MEKIVKEWLKWIWENPEREGLKDTPKRVVKAWQYITKWYKEKPEDILTTFENESDIDQIVGLSNIEFYSLCEHHLLPFYWVAHIYYIPGEKICWISKLARILDIYARRLQNQERIAKQVADAIEKYLQPKWVAVIIEAEHLCMKMRGVEKQCAKMKTSELRWLFRENPQVRQELFNLIKDN